MNARAFGLTDVGRCREANQDELLVKPELRLYAVADGMGGHAAGEIASQMAIESLAEAMSADAQAVHDNDVEGASRQLEKALQEGHRKICDTVVSRGEWRGMGTTIVAMILLDGQAVIGHVGDSRAYLLRGGELSRLTSDHSWVNEQVKLGLMTDEEAHRHPMRNIVTRALGNRTDLQVDISNTEAKAGDVFMLCSDGLNSMLEDPEIQATLESHAGDPEEACRALVDHANQKGGEDNITVIVLNATDEA